MAFLNRRDRYHRWATSQLAEEPTPLSTCEAVIPEACSRRSRGGSRAVPELLERGAMPQATRLMARYASVPMSLADACLVRMAEQHAESPVLTLDRDFTVYRRHGRLTVATVMPDRDA